MAEMEKDAGRHSKKHLWSGSGNYGWLPNMQIGGGYVSDPGLFDMLAGNAKIERAPLSFLTCANLVFLGLMALFMVASWLITLAWR
jgi:hypothetical protein